MKAFNEWLKSAIEVTEEKNIEIISLIPPYKAEGYNSKTVRFRFEEYCQKKVVFFFTIEYREDFDNENKLCNFVLLFSDKNSEFWNIQRLFAYYDDEQKHAEQYCDAIREKFEMEQYFDAMQKKCDLEQSVDDDGRLTQEELRAAWLDPKNGGRYFL